jgi:hypothetical protein
MVTTARNLFGSKAFAGGVKQSVIWVILGVAALIAVPNFERIYAEFGYGDARLDGAKLPDTTVAIISFTHVLRRFWYLALPLVCAWPFMNFGVVSFLSPSPEVVMPKRLLYLIPRQLWSIATWLVLVLVFVFAVPALFMPLIVDIQAISPAPVAPRFPGR